jgi:hypothetical protein
MSAPFTTIEANTDLQDLSLYTQIYRAYQQRHDAANTPAMVSPFLPVDGFDVQYYDLYSQLQAWLDGTGSESWAKYLDHTASIVGVADLPRYTLAQWRYVAGLHADGFRRVPGPAWPADWTDLNDPAYQYGHCQAGDIIGPWLLVDLQRGFSALRLTWQTPSYTSIASYYDLWANWSAMVADPQFDGTPEVGGYLERRILHPSIGDVLGYFKRVNLAINPWAGVDRAVSLYGLPSTSSFFVIKYHPIVLDGCGDFDLVPGFNLLHAAGSNQLPVSWDSPDAMAFDPPSDPGVDTAAGYDISNFAAVIQWDFTNI